MGQLCKSVTTHYKEMATQKESGFNNRKTRFVNHLLTFFTKTKGAFTLAEHKTFSRWGPFGCRIKAPGWKTSATAKCILAGQRLPWNFLNLQSVKPILKVMNKKGKGLHYLKKRDPWTTDTKIKEGIVLVQIKKTSLKSGSKLWLEGPKKKTWKSFK